MDLGRLLKVTSVVVTHVMQSAFRIADRIIMLYDGKVIEQGSADHFRQSPNEIVQQFIQGNAEGPFEFGKAGTSLGEQLLAE